MSSSSSSSSNDNPPPPSFSSPSIGKSTHYLEFPSTSFRRNVPKKKSRVELCRIGNSRKKEKKRQQLLVLSSLSKDDNNTYNDKNFSTDCQDDLLSGQCKACSSLDAEFDGMVESTKLNGICGKLSDPSPDRILEFINDCEHSKRVKVDQDQHVVDSCMSSCAMTWKQNKFSCRENPDVREVEKERKVRSSLPTPNASPNSDCDELFSNILSVAIAAKNRQGQAPGSDRKRKGTLKSIDTTSKTADRYDDTHQPKIKKNSNVKQSIVKGNPSKDRILGIIDEDRIGIKEVGFVREESKSKNEVLTNRESPIVQSQVIHRSSSDSDCDDLFAKILAVAEASETRQTLSMDEFTRKKIPRNPIAASKREDAALSDMVEFNKLLTEKGQSNRGRNTLSKDIDRSGISSDFESKINSNSTTNVSKSPTNQKKFERNINRNLWDGLSSSDNKFSDQRESKNHSSRKCQTRRTRSSDNDENQNKSSSSPGVIKHFSDEELEELMPNFSNPRYLGPIQPFEIGNHMKCQIPPAVSRYLLRYQKEGVNFMYQSLEKGDGSILGDDMGLGKTIQVIALLSALLKKSGTGFDRQKIYERNMTIEKKVRDDEKLDDATLLAGGQISAASSCKIINHSDWTPVLLVVPNGVVKNWGRELETWGHFSVCTYNNIDGESSVKQCITGSKEVMIISTSLIRMEDHFKNISVICWRLIVIDEFHVFRNKKNGYQHILALKNNGKCPVIGLTGTIMPNEHMELYNLTELVRPGLFGVESDFKNISKSIKKSRAKDATQEEISEGNRYQDEIKSKLDSCVLRRKKEDYAHLLNLTQKNEKVVFCEVSDVQKQIYRHILNLPDYVNIRYMHAPCDCGVNQAFFANLNKIKHDEKKKTQFLKTNRGAYKMRKKCCYKVPKDSSGGIHQDATIWKSQHCASAASGELLPCTNCPACTILPAMQKLHKLCSHPCLLQIENQPSSSYNKEWTKKRDFAEVALTSEIRKRLPGGTIYRVDSIMSDHTKLSGKMAALDKCLTHFSMKRNRVLLFSYSTATLDLIEKYIKAKGYTFLRLDGKTNNSKRDEYIKQFQANGNIFIFLISTKAGSLGLTLTAANKVIIYDVSWNPSDDSQAQDRSYRIGQTQDVEVIRLIARGTIEELIYARQLYKTHLSNLTLERGACEQPARLFRGIAGDKHKKGELFGSENLLRFSERSFLHEIWKSSNLKENQSLGIKSTDIASTISNLSTNDIGEFTSNIADELHGLDHKDFLSANRGSAMVHEGEPGFDEEVGGMSQQVAEICDKALETMPNEAPNKNQGTNEVGYCMSKDVRSCLEKQKSAKAFQHQSLEIITPKRLEKSKNIIPQSDNFNQTGALVAKTTKKKLVKRKMNLLGETLTQDVFKSSSDKVDQNLASLLPSLSYPKLVIKRGKTSTTST